MHDYWLIWGERIRDARLGAGYSTQMSLAAALGVNQGQVSRWERGLAAPSDTNRVKLVGLLHVPSAELFPYDAEIAA